MPWTWLRCSPSGRAVATPGADDHRPLPAVKKRAGLPQMADPQPATHAPAPTLTRRRPDPPRSREGYALSRSSAGALRSSSAAPP